jgi:hypothetical protein
MLTARSSIQYVISTARMACTATPEAASTSKKLWTWRRRRKNAQTQSIGRFKLVLTTILVYAPSFAFCQNQAAGEPSIAVAVLPQDLSPWGMFLHADQIVKVVMIGLAVASLITWTVWLAKSIELFGARAAVRRGLRALTESTTFAQACEKLSDGTGPVAHRV